MAPATFAKAGLRDVPAQPQRGQQRRGGRGEQGRGRSCSPDRPVVSCTTCNSRRRTTLVTDRQTHQQQAASNRVACAAAPCAPARYPIGKLAAVTPPKMPQSSKLKFPTAPGVRTRVQPVKGRGSPGQKWRRRRRRAVTGGQSTGTALPCAQRPSSFTAGPTRLGEAGSGVHHRELGLVQDFAHAGADLKTRPTTSSRTRRGWQLGHAIKRAPPGCTAAPSRRGSHLAGEVGRCCGQGTAEWQTDQTADAIDRSMGRGGRPPSMRRARQPRRNLSRGEERPHQVQGCILRSIHRSGPAVLAYTPQRHRVIRVDAALLRLVRCTAAARRHTAAGARCASKARPTRGTRVDCLADILPKAHCGLLKHGSKQGSQMPDSLPGRRTRAARKACRALCLSGG